MNKPLLPHELNVLRSWAKDEPTMVGHTVLRLLCEFYKVQLDLEREQRLVTTLEDVVRATATLREHA